MNNANNPLGTPTFDDCTNGGLVSESNLSTESNQEGCCVESVNGQRGVVLLTTDNIAEGTINKYLTTARVRTALSATTPLSYNPTTGEITHNDKPGLTPGVYGSDTEYPVVTIDSKGHVSAIESKVLPGSSVIGLDLSAIEALTGTGYLVRIGINSWAFRALAGTAGRIVATNGDPISGNTMLDLVASGVAAGTYGSATQVPRFTVDIFGRITGVSLVTISAGGGGGLPAVPTLGELLNVQDAADAPSTIGMVLTWSGTQWLAQVPVTSSTTFVDNVVTPVAPFLQMYESISHEPLNNVAKIPGDGDDKLVFLNTVLYSPIPDLPTTFPAPGEDLLKVKIGQLPAGYEPGKTTMLPCATTYPHIIGKYEDVAGLPVNTQQYIANCDVTLAIDGGIYLSAFAVSPSFKLANIDSVDIIIVSIVGAYYAKAPTP